MNLFFSYKPIPSSWMSHEEKAYLKQEGRSFDVFLIIVGSLIFLVALLITIFIKNSKHEFPEDLNDDEFKKLTENLKP
jgi:hypothetical protein